jgi:hypothetical protein
MAEQRPYTPEKLVIGTLVSAPDRIPELAGMLTDRFGDTDFESGLLPFGFSRYYDAEMGLHIFKKFWAFHDLVDPSRLASIKEITNGLEGHFIENGGRRVNLDPGILALSRFVLATTKEGSHRIPLTGGIFAEVTLQFAGGQFRDQPWTYPDFRSEEYKQILLDIREIYRVQLKNTENPRREGNR